MHPSINKNLAPSVDGKRDRKCLSHSANVDQWLKIQIKDPYKYHRIEDLKHTYWGARFLANITSFALALHVVHVHAMLYHQNRMGCGRLYYSLSCVVCYDI